MDEQGTIQGSTDGVTPMTYDRKVFFHRVTQDEMDNLMTTSLEFQIATTLTGLSIGALLSGALAQELTTVGQIIYYSSYPLTILLIVFSIYFLIKMNSEKKRYFKKYETNSSTEWEPSKEELTQMINDLLAQVAALQAQVDGH